MNIYIKTYGCQMNERDSESAAAMLAEAGLGILFRPSDKVRQQFPQFPVVNEYSQVMQLIENFDR